MSEALENGQRLKDLSALRVKASKVLRCLWQKKVDKMLVKMLKKHTIFYQLSTVYQSTYLLSTVDDLPMILLLVVLVYGMY